MEAPVQNGINEGGGGLFSIRLRMLILANLAQNVAYGLTFGFFGTLLVPVTRDMDVPIAAIAAGISLFGVVHGLFSPLVGALASAWSVCRMMVGGALLMATAFALMSITVNPWFFVISFGLLGGVAAACMGLTPVTMLLGQWFSDDKGKIFGLAMMPWLPMAAPVLGALIIEEFGWRAGARVVACVALITAALLTLVRSPIVEQKYNPVKNHDRNEENRRWRVPGVGLFRPDMAYWVLALMISVFSGATVVLLTYVPQYTSTLGFSLTAGATLVSIQGLCGMAGAPAFGLVFDKLRGPLTLAIVAMLLMISCALYALGTSYAWLVVASGAAGLVGGAATPLLAAMLSERYPIDTIGPAMGLASLIMLPFISILPMIGGVIVDHTGHYLPLFGFEILLSVLAMAACPLLAWLDRKPIRESRSNSEEGRC